MNSRTEPGFIPDNISTISHDSQTPIVRPSEQPSEQLIDISNPKQDKYRTKDDSRYKQIELISQNSRQNAQRERAVSKEGKS